MARKIVALFVLTAFSLFNLSCFKTTKRAAVVPSEVDRISRSKIVSVVTKDGKAVEFQKDKPGTFSPDAKAVTGMVLQDSEIDIQDVKNFLIRTDNKPGFIVTKDGRTYQTISSKKEAGKIQYSAYAPVTIPLSDITLLWIRKTNVLGIVGNVYIIVSVLGGIALAMMADKISRDMEESCPFVYSFNGEEYVLDAEPYGAAITEGLKRTDWVEMSNLRPVDGKYRVLLTNELDETQYTDELKLVAVDHAPGVAIAPDLAGRVHTFDRPHAPTAAFDQNGRDILPFVRANDKAFWLSPIEEKDPDQEGDFRDELVFEFPKPAGATTVKLLANAWTTMWGSVSAGKFLELYGSSLDESYRDVDRHGLIYQILQAWMARDELYQLKVLVETPDGWKARGTIFGGAPVVTKDKACVLDVGDVPGEVLRIKLRPPVNFWMVNSLAVDYGQGSPVRVTELAAEKAVDRSGRDVRAELAATDGLYLESPSDYRAELVFAAPPLGDGLERTVLVKASGYYRVHVESRGEPQAELIGRVLGEPGFAARYSFREYLKWEAGLRISGRDRRQ